MCFQYIPSESEIKKPLIKKYKVYESGAMDIEFNRIVETDEDYEELKEFFKRINKSSFE
jgi:hypothetical protein